MPLSQSLALCQGPGLTSIPLELSSPVPWPFQGLLPLLLVNGLTKAFAAQPDLPKQSKRIFLGNYFHYLLRCCCQRAMRSDCHNDG